MSFDSDSPLLRQLGVNPKPPRRGLPAWVWLSIAISLVAVLGTAVWVSKRSPPWQPPSGAPHFVSCTYGGRVRAWCGRLSTAADPRKPQGRRISLRIAVLPATRRPAAGALFYLEGGPGGAATASVIRVNADFARVGRSRDLVLVDQRGTGGSNPLACSNRYVRGADADAVTAFLRQCFARLAANPRLYTTSIAADDLETVRRRLGY